MEDTALMRMEDTVDKKNKIPCMQHAVNNTDNKIPCCVKTSCSTTWRQVASDGVGSSNLLLRLTNLLLGTPPLRPHARISASKRRAPYTASVSVGSL
jgi:hypothetical protein